MLYFNIVIAIYYFFNFYVPITLNIFLYFNEFKNIKETINTHKRNNERKTTFLKKNDRYLIYLCTVPC